MPAGQATVAVKRRRERSAQRCDAAERMGKVEDIAKWSAACTRKVSAGSMLESHDKCRAQGRGLALECAARSGARAASPGGGIFGFRRSIYSARTRFRRRFRQKRQRPPIREWSAALAACRGRPDPVQKGVIDRKSVEPRWASMRSRRRTAFSSAMHDLHAAHGGGDRRSLRGQDRLLWRGQSTWFEAGNAAGNGLAINQEGPTSMSFARSGPVRQSKERSARRRCQYSAMTMPDGDDPVAIGDGGGSSSSSARSHPPRCGQRARPNSPPKESMPASFSRSKAAR